MCYATMRIVMARPRKPGADTAIVEATQQLLLEQGYGGVSVEGVAARAGVAKTTVYRRWVSKAELVFEAAIHHSRLGRPPDTGSLTGDLAAVAAIIVRSLSRPVAAAALPGLMADLRSDQALRDRVVDRFIGAERAWIATIVDRACSRGEVARSPDPDLVLDLLVGPVFSRTFLTGRSASREFGERLAAVVGRGLTKDVNREENQ